jgi:hypothetical protein
MPQIYGKKDARGINSCPNSQTILDNSVLAALDQSGLPAFFPHPNRLLTPGHVRESVQVGTCPLWTSDSPTTLTCMLICIRAWPASTGCPSTGISHPTCSRIGRQHWSAASFEARLPMPLVEKRAMHIHAGVEVSVRFIGAHGTSEELSPFRFDALPSVEGEPLPLSSASRAILARSVGIYLNRTDP